MEAFSRFSPIPLYFAIREERDHGGRGDFELEDGVSPENKSMAREAAGSLLAELDFGNRETAVRINRISNLHGLADMTALAQWPHKPDLVVLPKVESAAEVCLYDELLTNSGVQSRLCRCSNLYSHCD